MKLMKLRDVEDITHVRNMTVEEACQYANPGYGRAQQALALSMLTNLNTRLDWLRLQACLVHLKSQKSVKRKR